MTNQALATKAALQWYLDHGVDEVLGDDPVDRTQKFDIVKPAQQAPSSPAPVTTQQPSNAPHTRAQAIERAATANTLEELKAAIQSFEGLEIKKTATNMVFADGNPKAHVMVIGEAPGADEDRQGKPFVGISGQLQDKILAAINLDRAAQDPKRAVYITDILNWRPPGGRSPTPQEIETSLPFIEKHIALVNPKLIILCGGVAAKSLLRSDSSISRLRGTFHDYVPQTIENAAPIPAIATYHPAYLLRTPAQKKAVWQDMLRFQEKMRTL